MNPNMPIKSRTRRNIRSQVEQEGHSNLHLSINHRHQPFTTTEHETHNHHNHHHRNYRLMEQQSQQTTLQQPQTPSHETEQMYVLDLSLKNKKNVSDDVETRSMSDDDVKIKSHQLPHPLQSLLSGFNKPLYTSNDMTMFWNMLMHFSFNNYQNYFSQFKDNNNVNVDVLKGRY